MEEGKDRDVRYWTGIRVWQNLRGKVMSSKTDRVIERLESSGLFDLDTGVGYCGSEEDYVDILEQSPYTFESSLGNLIKFYENGLSLEDEANLTEYRVVAHSIKSTARLLGHDALFETAKTSEFAVREHNVDIAIENHPTLVKETKEIIQLISSFFDGIDEDDACALGHDELLEVLRNISAAAEDFDVDTMDEGVKKLKTDGLPNAVLELRSKLIMAVANIDVDEVIAIVDTMIEGI